MRIPALSKQCQNEIPSEKKNPITTIRYYLSEASKISLDVYDLAGVHVATLDRGDKERGYYQVLFNGSTLSSGVYFYRLKTNSDVFTQKMILVK